MKVFDLSIFKSRGYISLDILRGIAAWLVAVPHFFLFTGYKSESLEFFSVLAVEIFFILSGFVLGPQLSLCFKNRTYSYIKTFFLRRWLRTLPIFFFILIIFLIFSERISLSKFIETLTFTYNFFSYDKNNTFFLVAWSLAIEEWFYILFPILGYTIFRKVKTIYFVTIFILFLMILKVYFQLFTEINFHRITILRLDSIALGYLTYLLLNNINRVEKRYLFLGLIANLILFLLSYYFFIEKHLLFFIIFTNLSAINLICLLKLGETRIKFNKMVKKVSAFFAHTSYCVYLCHSLIILLFFQNIKEYGLDLFFYYSILVILFSIASYYLIEKCFQGIRPKYQDIGSSSRHPNMLYFLGSNIIIFVALVIFLESISKVIPKVLMHRSFNKQQLKATESSNITENINKYSIYTDKEGLDRDFDNYPGDKYISYLTHAPQKYISEYLNIGKNGLRKNNNRENKTTKDEDFIIWIVGSSAIFGATNSDNETIAANLEKLYKKKFPNKNIKVLNLGVQGYNSLQDFLNIKFKLLEERKPKYILIINGYNDYYTAAIAKKSEIEFVTRTWSNSYNILSNAWFLNNNNKVLNFEIIKSIFFSNFTNFLEIVRLGKKWVKYKYFNNNLEIFVKKYKEKALRSDTLFSTNISMAEKFYLGNMEMIINNAKQFNIPIGVAQQPTLINTRKKLSNSEQEILKHRKLELFASDISSFNRKTIPTYEIDKNYFLNFSNFVERYNSQRKRLKSLAKEKEVTFFDLEKELEQYNNVPVFTSIVHFSFTGSKIIADILFKELNLDLK